jgi:O-antigen/teichoic acid export membrane protein
VSGSVEPTGSPEATTATTSHSHTQSPIKRLLVATSHYSIASLLVMVGGLISFPILTRTFSVAEYGIMNLIAATLTVSVALGKVGVQHSLLRFATEVDAGKSPYSIAQLTSTTLFGMIASAAVVSMVVAVAVQFVPESWLGDPRARGLFIIASILIVVQVTESALVNFLRAEQKTSALMKYQVVKRYLTLALILLAVLVISKTLASFYVASVIAESVTVVALAVVFFQVTGRERPALRHYSRPLYRELVKFGIPMLIGYELSGSLLIVGDRYVIQGMVGETPLGLYSAAYNLCQYVQGVFIASVGQAIMPMYMQMWDRKGPQETEAFIARSLRSYVLFGAPVVAGVTAVGAELLPSLASEKYLSAATVLPWVIAGMVMDGSSSMVGAGLFIHRKTRIIMAIVVFAALLNLGLNYLLIPRIGIVGSAIATLIAYTVNSGALAIAGRHLLRIHMPFATLLRAGGAAAVMYFAVMPILPGHRLITVAARSIVGAIVYGVLIAAIDPDARALARKALNRFRPRAAGGAS